MRNEWTKSESNPVLSIVHSLAKQNANVALTEIERNAKGLSREAIVTTLKDLQKQGIGEYVVGRRGFPSRFVVGATAPKRAPRTNNVRTNNVRIESVNYSLKLTNGIGRIELPATMSERDIATIESFFSGLRDRNH